VTRIVDKEGKLIALARTRDVLTLSPEGPAPERWPPRPLAIGSQSTLSEALEAMRGARTDWVVLKSGERSVGYLLLDELPARLMQA
jgi:hypothetical protein